MGNICGTADKSPKRKYEDSPPGETKPLLEPEAPLHTGSIFCIAACADKTFVSGGSGILNNGESDYAVKRFSWETKTVLNSWEGHSGTVMDVATDPDKGIAVSVSRDKSMKIWSYHEEQPKHSISDAHEMVINACDYSAGSGVWTGGRDHTVRTWDEETAQPKNIWKVDRNVVRGVVVTDEHCALQIGEDLKLRLWDTRKEEVAMEAECGPNIPQGLACNMATAQAATSHNGVQGIGCEIKLWDMRKFVMNTEFKGHEETTKSVAFVTTEDGPKLVSGSRDTTVKLWDLGATDCLDTVKMEKMKTVHCVATAGGLVFAGTHGGLVRVLEVDAAGGRLVPKALL